MILLIRPPSLMHEPSCGNIEEENLAKDFDMPNKSLEKVFTRSREFLKVCDIWLSLAMKLL